MRLRLRCVAFALRLRLLPLILARTRTRTRTPLTQMSFLFKPKQKSPAELVRATKDLLVQASRVPMPTVGGGGDDGGAAATPQLGKLAEDLSKHLVQVKAILYGGDGSGSAGGGGGASSSGGGGDAAEPNPELVSQLSQEVYAQDVLPALVSQLGKLEFEAKKDAAQIFNNLLRRTVGTRSPTVEYLSTREEVLLQLIRGYDAPEVALNCGLILRECIRHEQLAKIILYTHQSQYFYRFFQYVELSTFDLASDAFATFKELLTRHKALVAEFLEKHYDLFFDKYYTQLLNSQNYVTKRQSLKLLGELLLDRSNFNIMTKYIANAEHLKLMMNLLRDKSRNIQFEAFHVFKVFVANPNKPRPITEILMKNREKLIAFLTDFHNDRTDDEQFNDEKAFLIKQINDL